MLSRLTVLLAALAASAFAQPNCPSPNFLTAPRVNLKPSATSHVDLVRQSDGSYTGFEVADAVPYRVIQTTPHFERQLAACIPHTIGAPLVPASRLGIATGEGSQLQVAAAVGANFFVGRIGADQVTIYFDVFDAQHNLISDSVFTLRFAQPGSLQASNEVFQSLALADLNGDGKLDLAVVFNNPLGSGLAEGGVYTFLGNGEGTFQPGNRQVLTSRPQPVAAQSASIADLNGDGKPDLVLTAPYTAPVNVFLGKGDGSFQTQALPLTIPADCLNPFSAAVGDLNGDGKPDLVFSPCQNTQGTVAGVALGNGDGTFQTPAFYPALWPATSSGAAAMVAIGDVNGDGIADIVTAGGTILFGNGKGGVASRVDYSPNFAGVSFGDFLPTGAGPVLLGASVMLGDFDGDGETDILFGMGNVSYLSGSTSYRMFAILFGSGGGVFAGAPVSGLPLPISNFTYGGPLPPPSNALVSADFNGDSIPDLASVTFAQTSDTGGNVQLTMLRGRGNGLFSSGTTQTFVHAGAFLLRAATTADFNHDGQPDLAVLLGDYPTGGEIQIYLGKGDGTFGSPSVIPVSTDNPLSVAAVDINGDGVPDLTVAGEGPVAVFPGKGDGTFGAPSLTPVVENAGIVFGDFNGDGKVDIAAAGEASTGVSILLGKGDGTFSPALSAPLPAPAAGFPGQIAVGDFNGDGRLDLAVALSSNRIGGAQQVAILLGKGDGSFAAPILSTTGMEGLVVADLNGDKIPDLVGFVSPALGPPNPSGALSVRLGNGDGTFQPDQVVMGVAEFFVVADLNHDGLPDIAALYGGGVLSLLNDSSPAAPLTVVSAATFAAGPLAPGAIAAGFGAGFLTSGQMASGTAPLPMTLAGISVNVQDAAGVTRQASLYFVSSNQVNFVVPGATAPGTATVTVNGVVSGKPLTVQVQIAAVAPALFTVGSGIAAAYGVLATPGGMQMVLPVYASQSGIIVPVPIDLSQVGLVYLMLFGTGFDAANANSVTATVQGVKAPVTYVGPQGSYAGLDQINVLLPQTLAGTGVANVNVSVGGVTANTVMVTIK